MRSRKTEKDGEKRRRVRPTTRKQMREGGKTRQSEESFVRDTSKLWNQAPKEIKEAQTIGAAKVPIKQYCKTMQI